jgi:hypothetical protein
MPIEIVRVDYGSQVKTLYSTRFVPKIKSIVHFMKAWWKFHGSW